MLASSLNQLFRKRENMKGRNDDRGLFQRKNQPGVWWVGFFHNGKQYRKKIGRKADARAYYQRCKAESRAGVLFSPKRPSPGITLENLIDDVLLFVADHKDERNYKFKAGIVKEALGSKDATTFTPQEIDAWLRNHCKTPATANRYKAFFSLCFRQGIANGKVSSNPARSVRRRPEPQGRQRFLSRDEYKRLEDIILACFPERHAEFVVSVHTGMRQGEQFAISWGQVDLDRKTIDLTDTKNGDNRIVHLNKAALEALQSIKPIDAKETDLVFPDEKTRHWFNECLDAIGIEDYTWHNNRHSFCSWLAMAGASIKDIQEAAGHKTIAMAARYSHLSPQHTASVVDRLIFD
jgi:integrase